MEEEREGKKRERGGRKRRDRESIGKERKWRRKP